MITATARQPIANWGLRLTLDMIKGAKVIPMVNMVWRRTARTVGERWTPGKIRRVRE